MYWFWRVFLTIYILFFFMMQLGALMDGYQTDLLFNLFFLSGETIGIAAAIIFINKIKARPKLPIAIFLFIFHLVFTLWRLLVFSVSFYNYPELNLQAWNLLFNVLEISVLIVSLMIVFKVFVPVRVGGENFKTRVWRVYLWVFFVIPCLMFPTLLLDIGKWTFYDYFSNISIVILLAGLYSYIFKKMILSALLWKYYFWFSIIFTTLEAFFYLGLRNYFILPDYLRSHSDTGEDIPIILYIVFMVAFLPLYYPLYKIAYDKNFFKKDK